MDVRERRLQLVAAGYVPVPLFGKTPPSYGKNNKRKGLSGWQNLQDITAEQVEMWSRTWPDARIPLPPSLDPVWQIFDTSHHKTGWRRIIIRCDRDDAE